MDAEAADVVRRIFRLSADGIEPHKITRILMEDNVECPSYYLAKQGRGTRQRSTDMSRPYVWNATTVRDILAKPEYMGHTVNFRSYRESYKDKHAIKRPPEEWTVFENAHEAVADPETWKLAQRVRETVRRTDTTGIANPLTGLMFCADCGAKMYNRKEGAGALKKGWKPDSDSGLYPSNYYDCSSYRISFARSERKCCSHYITTRAVRALILGTIRTVSTYAISDEKTFVEKIRVASQIRQDNAAKELKRKLNRNRKHSAKLDRLIQ